MKKFFTLILVLVLTLTLTACKKEYHQFKDFDKELETYKTEVLYEDYKNINNIVDDFDNNHKDKDYEIFSYFYKKSDETVTITDNISANLVKESYGDYSRQIDYDSKVVLLKENLKVTSTEKSGDKTTNSKKEESHERAYQTTDGNYTLVDNKTKIVYKLLTSFENICGDYLVYDALKIFNKKENAKYFVDGNLYTLEVTNDDNNKDILQIKFSDNEITILSMEYKNETRGDLTTNKLIVSNAQYTVISFKEINIEPLKTKGFIVREVGDFID